MIKKRGKKKTIKLKETTDLNQNKFKVKLWAVILSLIIILVILLILYYPKNCNKDISCFSEKVSRCSKAKLTHFVDGNEFFYEILDKRGSDCLVSIKINKMKEGTNYNLVNLLEGKNMLCEIPIINLKDNPVPDIKEVLGKCSGPLKEALQQITIERLYSVVVSNLGSVNEELLNLISK